MVESNLKRLLAYSSVAQVGYILLGASFSDTAGLSAGIVHMFNHALAKGTLFLAVAAFAMRAASLRLEDLAGFGRSMPWTSAAFVLAGASLVGIPGTAGFISKWLLLQAAFAQGWLGIISVVVVVLSSLGAVFYIWRVIEQLYFGSVDQAQQATTREGPVVLLLGIWLGALANVYFGLVPDLPLSLSSSAAADLLRHLP
jgi:multicomponent Na+:H+ antiporter subunit D